MKKARGDAILKNLDADVQAGLFAQCQAGDYDAAKKWLAEKHGIVVRSNGTFSKWFAWYPLAQRLTLARDYGQTIEDTLRRIPDLKLTPGQITAAGQLAFEAKAIQEDDPKLFVALARLRELQEGNRLAREQFQASLTSEIEKGLDQLAAEFQDNAEALDHFTRARAVVQAALDRKRK